MHDDAVAASGETGRGRERTHARPERLTAAGGVEGACPLHPERCAREPCERGPRRHGVARRRRERRVGPKHQRGAVGGRGDLPRDWHVGAGRGAQGERAQRRARGQLAHRHLEHVGEQRAAVLRGHSIGERREVERDGGHCSLHRTRGVGRRVHRQFDRRAVAVLQEQRAGEEVALVQRERAYVAEDLSSVDPLRRLTEPRREALHVTPTCGHVHRVSADQRALRAHPASAERVVQLQAACRSR